MKSSDPKKKYGKPGSIEHAQTYPGIESSMVTKPSYEYGKKEGRLLEGKVALVTGGDSGIGRAVAVAFAKEGANVAIQCLPSEELDAKETIAHIQKEGRQAFLMTGDLVSNSFAEELVEDTVNKLGAIDILVNNAGLQKYYTSLEDVTPDDFAQIYQINVIAPFVLSKRASVHMKPGGSIINTASIKAYDPDFLLLPYAVSKSALVSLTKGLAEEMIKKGIRVNAVAPGPIWSPLNTHGSPKKKLQSFGEHTLFKRPGQPAELAPVYVLLASDEASYITGEVYGVTGGSGIA